MTVIRDMDKGGENSVYDSVAATPNATHNGAGIINIRGVEGTGPGTGYNTLVSGSRPRVSTTVDGMSESWNGQRYVDVSPWDVEQVEVLRGPQSTTQGRNTLAGAIVVNTKDPSFDWARCAPATRTRPARARWPAWCPPDHRRAGLPRRRRGPERPQLYQLSRQHALGPVRAQAQQRARQAAVEAQRAARLQRQADGGAPQEQGRIPELCGRQLFRLRQ